MPMALHTAQLMCIVVFVITVTGKAQCINNTHAAATGQSLTVLLHCSFSQLSQSTSKRCKHYYYVYYKYLILFLQWLSKNVTVYITMNITNCNLSPVEGTITNTCEIFTTAYQCL